MPSAEYEGDSDATPGSHLSVRHYLEEVWASPFSEGRMAILLDTIDLLIPGIIAEAKRRGEPRAAYGLATEAMKVVGNLDFHLHPGEEGVCKRMLMWRHQKDHAIASPATSEITATEKQGFETTVSEYMARPWMQHDYLDWCIVDALTAHEWAAYLFYLRGQRSLQRLVMAFSVAFYGLPLLGLGYLFWSDASFAFPALLGYAALVIWGFVGLAYRSVVRFTSKTSSPRTLLLAMRDAYASLDGLVLSPSRVRDQLRLASAKGWAGHR